MTVQELIDLLSAVEDRSANVTIDGCDCSADASAVFTEGGRVYLAREDTEWEHEREGVRVIAGVSA